MPPRRLLASSLLVMLAACASNEPQIAVPAALQPPKDQSRVLEAFATGVQIYVCSPKSDGRGLAWTFRAPEATLKDKAGKVIGRHFAGPTWEGSDGSAVIGEVKARDPGPDPTAIPWLLLQGRGNGVSGTFSALRSIQRVSTVGGLAPTTPCNIDQFNRESRVPYSATYYFFR